jgi:hypothetical protein
MFSQTNAAMTSSCKHEQGQPIGWSEISVRRLRLLLGFLGGSLTIVNDHMPVERFGPADAIGSILKGNLESGRLQNLAYLIAAFLKTELALQFVVVGL